MRAKLVALPVLVAMLIALSIPAHAAPTSSRTYEVRMTDVVGTGLLTDCAGGAARTLTPTGYVVARDGSGYLHAQGQDLNLDLVKTNIQWTRKYNVGHGDSGLFNGCYGVTQDWPGDLHLIWQGSSLRFVWHFEYFGQPGANPREYFTIEASRIPFPAWKPGMSVEGTVNGNFPFYLTLVDDSTNGRTQRQDLGSVTVSFRLRITCVC